MEKKVKMMRKALVIAVVMLSTLLIASIAVSAEGYGANSIANNASQTNVSAPMNASATNTLPSMNASSGANASASAVSLASAAAPAAIASASVSNATAKATNASAPYGTPGFEGILSLTGLMAMAYLALGRIR